uniref:Reverse transcriptase domain-containing protein n=1 Tax=Syphacia muris TaxID=451379 RepID=A0A0N5B1M5_9BILA
MILSLKGEERRIEEEIYGDMVNDPEGLPQIMEEARLIVDDLQKVMNYTERLLGNRASKDIETESGPLESKVKVGRGKRVKLPDVCLIPFDEDPTK